MAGQHPDEYKEEAFLGFVDGKIRVLVTKPKIGGFGMNWQHCSHMTFFPSHSYEQWYQGIRRCWRFGQKSPVIVDVIATEGEFGVTANLRRKSEAAEKMFEQLIAEMNNALRLIIPNNHKLKEEIPAWL